MMKTVHDHPGAKLKHPRPYNVYNIFFILERARLIQQHFECIRAANSLTPAIQSPPSSVDFSGYEQLCLPELPPRYHDLQLLPNWFVPGKNAKRKHVATNGLRNFTALAQTVAQNWRAVDQVTFSYCQSVAKIIKERHADLTKDKRGLQQPREHSENGRTTKKTHPEKGGTTTMTQCLPGAAMKPILFGKETKNKSSSKKCASAKLSHDHEGVTPSCHHRSLIGHSTLINTSMALTSFPNLPEEGILSSYSQGRVHVQSEEEMSNVVTQTSKIFDTRTGQYLIARKMTSSPTLTSLMSSLNPMPGENAIGWDTNTMLWQINERNPSADKLRHLNDTAPLDQLQPFSFISESCDCEDDFRNVSDSEVNELRRLLLDGK